jgi:hypothetical protein
MKLPDTYAGESTDDFRLWWFQVRNYLDYHKNQFETDQDRITWMATILEKKALAWYRNRGIELDDRRQKDTWAAFSSALSEQFTDRLAASKLHDQMSRTRYENDVQDYLTKMETLNIRVRLRGIPWQKALKTGLPAWFRDKMALGNKKRDFDDDEYIETHQSHRHCPREREQEKKDKRETLRLLTEKSASKGKEKSNPEKSKNDGGRKPKRQSDRKSTAPPKAESSSKKDEATHIRICRRPLRAFLRPYERPGRNGTCVCAVGSKDTDGMCAEDKLLSRRYIERRKRERQRNPRRKKALNKPKFLPSEWDRLDGLWRPESQSRGFMRWRKWMWIFSFFFCLVI